MHSKNLDDKIQMISSFLNSEMKAISTNLSEFGYRERIKIERCLFLLIKILCKKELNYDLQGFSKNHIEKLSSIRSINLSSESFFLIIDKAYQIKIYLKALSSENGYVRGDALSKLGLNRKTVFAFIQEQLKSILNKVTSSNLGNPH